MKKLYPKVCLNILIIQDKKILLGLLSKNWLHNGKQVYGLPGRDLLFRETFGQGVKRDIKEELDIEVTSYKVISVNANYEYGNHYVEIGILAETKGDIKLLKTEDWEKWEWFDLNDESIPPSLRTGGTFGGRKTRRMI